MMADGGKRPDRADMPIHPAATDAPLRHGNGRAKPAAEPERAAKRVQTVKKSQRKCRSPAYEPSWT